MCFPNVKSPPQCYIYEVQKVPPMPSDQLSFNRSLCFPLALDSTLAAPVRRVVLLLPKFSSDYLSLDLLDKVATSDILQ